MASALRILAGLVLGLATGALLLRADADLGASVIEVGRFVGGLWINALRMTVMPLILALIVSGVASAMAAARAGRMTSRAIAFFIVLLAAAGSLGALSSTALLSLLGPSRDAAQALISTIGGGSVQIPPQPPVTEIMRGIIPPNPVEAAAEGSVLPFVVFALFLGFAVGGLAGESRALLSSVFEAFAKAMLRIVSWVLWIAPVGVFALALTLAATGLEAAGVLLHYVVFASFVAFLGTVAAYVFVLVGRREMFIPFLKYAAPAQVVAISTQSSLASLPVMLKSATNMGIRQEVASLVLPLAVSMFRFTNPLVNVSIALYAAHLYGLVVSPEALVLAIATAMLTNFSAVGISSQVSFFVALVPIFAVIGVPLEILGILIALETIPDMFRTLGNVSMDVAVTTVIDRRQLKGLLAGEKQAPIES